MWVGAKIRLERRLSMLWGKQIDAYEFVNVKMPSIIPHLIHPFKRARCNKIVHEMRYSHIFSLNVVYHDFCCCERGGERVMKYCMQSMENLMKKSLVFPLYMMMKKMQNIVVINRVSWMKMPQPYNVALFFMLLFLSLFIRFLSPHFLAYFLLMKKNFNNHFLY